MKPLGFTTMDLDEVVAAEVGAEEEAEPRSTVPSAEAVHEGEVRPKRRQRGGQKDQFGDRQSLRSKA